MNAYCKRAHCRTPWRHRHNDQAGTISMTPEDHTQPPDPEPVLLPHGRFYLERRPVYPWDEDPADGARRRGDAAE